MLTLDIEKRGNKPIYEYIYSFIRDEIRKGNLVSGEKLPSKRELATNNGVALITVENAYEQLIVEGYIEAKPRSGYYVVDIEYSTQADFDYSYVNDSEELLNTDEQTDAIVADFVYSASLADSFPYSIWAKLIRRVVSDRTSDFMMAPPSTGIIELKKACAGYLFRSKNIKVDDRCIVIGPGTEYLHSILLQLIGRNRIVAVEDPGYKKAEKIYETNGMKVMHIPVDEEGLIVDRLEGSNIKLIHVSPAHHFPTGTVMSASRRHKLISWAVAHSAYIIEDDYDSEFRYKGRPLPTLMSINDENVIYMNTFTSSLSPSIRIAYMVLPQALMKIYEEKLDFVSGTVSTFEQLTLAAFINEGFYERHIVRMRNKCRKLKQMYEEQITLSGLDKYVSVREDYAGFNAILDIPSIEDDEAFKQCLLKKGIILRCITDYSYNTQKEYGHRFILKYADISIEQLQTAFKLILEAINENSK